MMLQVSWVRHRDIHLLTVGRYTYTSDQRFRAIHHPHSEDWTLQIKYPQHRDSGIYECQISTTPHMSHFIHLNVVELATKTRYVPEIYFQRGSKFFILHFILRFIYFSSTWFRDCDVLMYSNSRFYVGLYIAKIGDLFRSFLLLHGLLIIMIIILILIKASSTKKGSL
ncbi:hypothetical protein L9F63_000916, partial [Diploptera punctata]